MEIPAITQFLDEQGRIARLPAKRRTREAVLAHLASQFESGRVYTEKEVNAICDQWHTFHDYFLLRRELVDQGFLQRRTDGSAYWRGEERQAQAENKDQEGRLP